MKYIVWAVVDRYDYEDYFENEHRTKRAAVRAYNELRRTPSVIECGWDRVEEKTYEEA